MWQPIETAPRDGTRILLCMGDDGASAAGHVVIGRFYKSLLWGEVWEFAGEYTVAIEGATHWMPLPERAQ